MIKILIVLTALVGSSVAQIVLRDQPDVKFTLGLAALSGNQDQVVRVQRPQVQSIQVRQPQIQVVRSQPQVRVIEGQDNIYRFGGNNINLVSQPQTIRIQAPRQQVVQIAQPQIRVQAPRQQVLEIAQPQIRVQAPRQQVVQIAQPQIRVQQQNSGVLNPFEFNYKLEDKEGSHGHTARGDGSGRVEGEYSINLGEGKVRVVKYVADENGYRADVFTDELGTESKAPTNVYIDSKALSGTQAALTHGPFAPDRVEAPLQKVQQAQRVRNIQNSVALPTYGTFPGGKN